MLFPFLKNWRATKVRSECADVESYQIELTKAKLEIENLSAKNDALRKELERSNQLNLKRQRERFLEIIRSMRDGLCVIDDAGFITFANPVAEKLLDSKNLIGENFFSFIEFARQKDQKELEKNSSYGAETESSIMHIRNAKNTPLPLKCSWSDLRDENNKFVGQVIVFSDYSIELEIQHRLEQARDRAVEMSKLKSEFLATMSHEIRTPLNGIISIASLLEMSELNDEQKEDVADLKASSNQLLEIISNILDLSKIESGKMYLDYQKFSPVHLVNDLTRIFSAQLEKKNLLFLPEMIGPVPEYVLGDYTRIKQVLVNLIGNAIKFTGVEGCIVLMVKALQSSNPCELEFSVIDTGVGISSEHITNIFQPFHQADGSITRNFGGTGLGLTICKNLVDLMGGNISVKSKEGIGTAFTFSLFLEKTTFSAESLARLKTLQAGPSTEEERKATILIVDDNNINLSTTSRYLKKFGLNIISANSGQSALQIASQGELDLILLDLHMPNMSGYEVTRHIREGNEVISQIPIIAMTADVLESTRDACMDAGFTGFVTKPVNLPQLVKSIDELLKTNMHTKQ